MPYKLEDGVTQSMLLSFLQCRQRTQNLIEGWGPVESTSVFDYGTIIHELLDLHYRGKLHASNAKGKDLSIGWAVDAIVKEMLKKPADAQALEESARLATMVFPGYLSFWKKQHAKWKDVQPETVFNLKWGATRLRGKIDLRFRLNGKLWMKETKTKSRIEEDVLDQTLAFDFQSQFYLLALGELTGEKVEGVVYDIVRKPQMKADSVPEDMRKRPDHYFKRFEVIYTKDQNALFRQELDAILQDFKDWAEGNAPHYRNSASCVGRGRCPYIQACSQGSMLGYVRNKKLFSELGG